MEIGIVTDYWGIDDAIKLANEKGLPIVYDNECVGSCSDMSCLYKLMMNGYKFRLEENGHGGYKAIAHKEKK